MLGLFKQSLQNKKGNSSIKDGERVNLYNQLNALLMEHTPVITSQNEHILIKKIKKETNRHNLNNITRTKAYLDFFIKHQEIHWAFLAHMVSRNGGYSMTDFKGSMIGDLIVDERRKILFHFLERANALIFHDAYPQLLLFEESRKERKSFFHLLPAFQISRFMIPIWEHFLVHSNSTLLTLALITNEQQYLEKHLMSKQTTKESIFHTLTYILQEKMGLTYVAFPYKRYPFLRLYSLTGLKVHEFSSVNERIIIGKKLYSILFSKLHYGSCFQFAHTISHSGSRSDYWPHIFTINKRETEKVYSPPLLQVWNQKTHHFTSTEDWFSRIQQINGFEIGLTESHTDLSNVIKRDITLLLTLGKIKNEIPSIS